MKPLKSLILYLTVALLPCTFIYLVFEGFLFLTLTALYLVIWFFVFKNIDKAILISLKAREVIDTDNQLFFQFIKNESYKTLEELPRVYIYTGYYPNCFILKSGKSWSVVIERGLMDGLQKEELEYFVSFLYQFKMHDNSWGHTKLMGINCLLLKGVHFLLGGVLFLKTHKAPYKVMSVFLFGICFPLIYCVESLAKKRSIIEVNENLKSFLYKLEKSDFSFYHYILGHINKTPNIDTLQISYLECFPPVSSYRFREYEF